MRIERIKITNLPNWEDVDVTLPDGPVLLFCGNRRRQRMLRDLFLELFYDLKNPPASLIPSRKGLGEIWLSREDTRFHIGCHLVEQDDGLKRDSTFEIEDGAGKRLSLPEMTTLGEYLFGVTLQAFRQGGVVEWLDGKSTDYYYRRARNLRQGGDEGLSLSKVRASLAGAQKKVIEQTESMALVKAEYDSLRREWEEAHRQQEQQRALLIEQKNLQEKEKIIAERIACETKIQDRLAVLSQNSDYRELRYLQGEQIHWEERCQEAESKLAELTLQSQVDWEMIESLRAECLEWAGFQEQVDHLTGEIRMRTQEIRMMEDSVQTSGYLGVSENEVQRLRRAEEERAAAQKELDREFEKLTLIKSELEKTKQLWTDEIAKLRSFANMAEVTADDELRIAQRERYLAMWQRFQIGSILDRILKNLFGTKSISERLAWRLEKYYHYYHVSCYQEFTNRLQEFRDQQQLVERRQMELEKLLEKVRWEEKLLKIVNSRSTIIKRACSSAKAADFSAWLNGWADYQGKKQQLTVWNDELQSERQQQQLEKNKLRAAAERLRGKLENWGTPATDREEVLAVVMKVARQLRAKDEAEREFALISQKYSDLLGERDLEQLAEILEPLADLEREMRLSHEERLEEMAAWRKEQLEISGLLAETEQNLQESRKFPALSVLEKKIEVVKRQWTAFDGLQGALDDAQALLESSWNDWQDKYGKLLQAEKQWILSQISSPQFKETVEKNEDQEKRDYFAYRMALAQLAFRDNPEVPLFFLVFSVNETNEGLNFWKETLGHFHKLSLSRQVILSISDVKPWQLETKGWQRLFL